MKLQSLTNGVSLLFLIAFQPYLIAQENAQENKLPCDIVEEEVLENTPQDAVELITAFNPAKPVERVNPTFPSSAARVNAEGWVQMSYVIDKDGNVQDPMIEDSGGHSSFKRSALKAISQWKFEPAMKDGKATEQCHQSIQFDFALADNAGADRRFIRDYKKLEALIMSGEYTAAETLIETMHDDKRHNRYENAWLWSIDASLASKQGDQHREMKSISRTLASSKSHSAENKTFDDNYVGILHKRLFLLQAQSSLLGAALKTLEDIKALPNADSLLESLESTTAKLSEYLASDKHIFVNVELEDSGEYFHKLARNKFAFANIQGQVDTVEVRCKTRREKFTVAEDFVWSIPQTWGECQVVVQGESETKFDLVEVSAS
jgi:TonB family protein